MTEARLHPMLHWWRTKSKWSDGTDFPHDALSEGQLAVDAWNAAIDAVCKVEPVIAGVHRIQNLKYQPKGTK